MEYFNIVFWETLGYAETMLIIFAGFAILVLFAAFIQVIKRL